MARALLAIAGNACLVAYACRQIPDHQPDGKHHGKGQNVLHVRDSKRPARSDKKKVEADDVDHRCQHRRPAAIKERDHNDAEQINHDQIGGVEGDEPLAGNHRNQGAKDHGHQATPDLNAPFIAKGASIRRTVGQRGGLVIQRDDD